MKETKTNTATKDSTKRQTLQGTVVSDKMQKTVVVKVSRYVKHPKYGKYYSIDKRIKAHTRKECIKQEMLWKLLLQSHTRKTKVS
jgi:small subunit ribosomal protein S17